MTPAVQLAEGLRILEIDLPATTQTRLLDYLAVLEKWNRVYQLTALRDASLAVSHHLLDSLGVLPFVQSPDLLDVGSGGGMPGIPLAIACPELRVLLLDSNSKKAAFLRQAVIELGLTNIAVHCGRVEKFQSTTRFTAIIARAFSSLANFVTLSRHLRQAEGSWLAMKGQWPTDEIAQLPADVALKAAHALKIPGVDGERHLLVIGNSET